jgi:hypothetical protein
VLEHADPAGVPKFDPAWRTAPVVGLVATPSATDVLPILADALQEAGCADDRILAHCRSDGPHRPDCWVLALIRTFAQPQPPSEHAPQTLREAFRIIWSEPRRARGTWREWFAYTSPVVLGAALAAIGTGWFPHLDQSTAWWMVLVASLVIGLSLIVLHELRNSEPPPRG